MTEWYKDVTELVSILIPARNAGRTLAQTLKSALAQTWPATEIVVVDDGSTDHTRAVAECWASPRLRVLTQPCRGASAARNVALTAARGDWIQWLDADDLLAPDKLARQLAGAGSGRRDRVLLAAAFGEFLVHPVHARFRPSALWRDLAPVEFLLHRFRDNLWLNPACWLTSRRLAEQAGFWDERLSLNDDGEYSTRLVTASAGIRFVPEARVYYRRGDPGSLSRGGSPRAADSLLLSLELCIAHLRALEDSPRTRAAGVALLQTELDLGNCVHPGRPDLLRRAESLARELCGELRPPRLAPHYRPVAALFGWNAAKRAAAQVSALKLLARVQAERLRPVPHIMPPSFEETNRESIEHP